MSNGSLENSGDVPENSGGIQERSGGILEKSGVVPERSGVVPEKSGVVPEKSDVVPEMSDSVQESSGDILEKSGCISERSDVILERSGIVRERSGDVRERSDSVPERSGGILEDSNAPREISDGESEKSSGVWPILSSRIDTPCRSHRTTPMARALLRKKEGVFRVGGGGRERGMGTITCRRLGTRGAESAIRSLFRSTGRGVSMGDGAVHRLDAKCPCIVIRGGQTGRFRWPGTGFDPLASSVRIPSVRRGEELG